jgi:hypothetical protein
MKKRFSLVTRPRLVSAQGALAVALVLTHTAWPAWARSSDFERAPGWLAVMPADRQPVVPVVQAKGREWFVDAVQGDDRATGSKAKPWKTLSRIQRASFGEGDVVRLRCGGVWRETLRLGGSGTPSDLTLAPDGECGPDQAPSIRGSDPVDGPWLDDATQAGVWVANRTDAVVALIFKGQRLMPARLPDFIATGQEFAQCDTLGSAHSFRLRDKERAMVGDRDLVGATVYVRPVPWQVERALVRDYDRTSGILTLDKDLSASILTGSGYILEGKRWMLSAPGEWFHDRLAGKLYLVGPSGQRPLASEVEAVTRDQAMLVRGVNHLRLVGLDLQQTALAAVDIQDAKDVDLEGLTIAEPGEQGVLVYRSAAVSLKGSRIAGAGSDGVLTRNAPDGLISGNLITDTGLRARAGGSGAAIVVNGERSVVEGNVLWRMANPGIHFHNKEGTRVQDNIIIRPCMRMTDCGGIHTWTAHSPDQALKQRALRAVVRNNVILGGAGNLEGTGGRGRNQTVGIYLDEMTGGVQVVGNLVVGTENGMYLHNAQFNDVLQNTFRSVTHANITAHNSLDGKDVIRGNRFRDNSMVTRPVVRGGDEVFAFKWQQRADPNGFFAGGDANEVADNTVIRAGVEGDSHWYMGEGLSAKLASPADWKRHAGRERELVLKLPPEPASLSMLPRTSLLTDGDFRARPSAWSPYFTPAGHGGSASPMSCAGSPCLRYVSGDPGDVLSSKSFRMDSQAGRQAHVLRYTVKAGPKGGTVRAVVRRNGPPFDNFGLDQPPMRLNPGQVLQAELPFDASSSDPARVDFSAEPGAEVYLSRVSLVKVDLASALPPTAAGSLLLLNLSGQSTTLSCPDAGLTRCAALDDQGRELKWPLTLTPRQSVTVFPLQPRP